MDLPYAYLVTDFERLNLGPDANNFPYDFVAGNDMLVDICIRIVSECAYRELTKLGWPHPL
jgi:hypothetical protein